MANFLQNLALRSFAPQTALRPQTEYRFARELRTEHDSAPNSRNRSEALVQEEGVSPRLRSRERTPVEDFAARPSVPEPPIPTAPQSPRTLSASGEPTPQGEQAVADVIPAATPHLTPRPLSVARQIPPMTQTPDTVPASIIEEGPRTDRRATPPTPSPLHETPAVQPAPEPTVETRVTGEQRVDRQTIPQSVVLAPPPTPLPILQPPPAVLPITAAVPANRTSEAGGSRTALSHTEPTIHVTIGRIEIRAAKETGRPERKAPADRPPGHDLQEYLNRRGGV